MAKILELTVTDAKPLRHGMDYLWSVVLDLTRDQDTFFFRDVQGRCDQSHLIRVRLDLAKLVNGGFIERLPAERAKAARPYRLLKRQSKTPLLRTDGGSESTAGFGMQHMWNVMRRARSGFTVPELALDASTDDVKVTYQNAYQYCQLLERAGILKIQHTGERGRGSTYVLLGSANTGPKPPRRYKAVMVYDQNRNRIVGSVEAEEASSC